MLLKYLISVHYHQEAQVVETSVNQLKHSIISHLDIHQTMILHLVVELVADVVVQNMTMWKAR